MNRQYPEYVEVGTVNKPVTFPGSRGERHKTIQYLIERNRDNERPDVPPIYLDPEHESVVP
jgi:hypothetical protein